MTINAVENIRKALELAAKADHHDSIKDVAWMRKHAKQALGDLPALERLEELSRTVTELREALASNLCPDGQGLTVKQCIDNNQCGCSNKKALAKEA